MLHISTPGDYTTPDHADGKTSPSGASPIVNHMFVYDQPTIPSQFADICLVFHAEIGEACGDTKTALPCPSADMMYEKAMYPG